MPGYGGAWDRLAAKAKRALTERMHITGIQPKCWLCTEYIDLTLDHRDRMSLTFDHIVAKIDGGQDSLDNIAPAHRACNTRRSNEMKKHRGNRIVNTRDW